MNRRKHGPFRLNWITVFNAMLHTGFTACYHKNKNKKKRERG